MNLPQTIRAAGFLRHAPDHPRSFDGLVTWEKDGLRFVISPESLSVERGSVVRYCADPGEITLQRLTVDPGVRRQKKAHDFLNLLTCAADRLGVTLFLEPHPFEAPSPVAKLDLLRLYRQYGFITTDITEKVMRRPPMPR